MEKKVKKPWWLLPIALVIGIVLGVGISSAVGTIFHNLQTGDSIYSVIENNGYTGRASGDLQLESPDEAIVEQAKNSAVTVLITQDGEDYGIGSGIIIRETGEYFYVITNAHVVDDADEIYVYFVDEEYARAICTLVGSNAKEDIALIKVNKEDLKEAVGETRFSQFTAVSFGDSDTVQQGDSIFLVGNPTSAVFAHTVNVGVVSGLEKNLTLDGYNRAYYCVDASMYYGNSGGGAFNYKGELIGICGAKISIEGVYNMNFILYGNTAKEIVEGYMANEN